jgi:serine phosphatase RsbU (regulator of sigma subunit)
LQKQNEQEYYRGKDLEAVLAQATQTKAELNRESDHVQFDIDALRSQNAKQNEDAAEMQSEVEALNKHMNLLNQQNYELSVELEKFIEADEVVRRGLNRREKVEQIRYKVDDAIRKSQAEVERRRSPERGARRG